MLAIPSPPDYKLRYESDEHVASNVRIRRERGSANRSTFGYSGIFGIS
jgi:hypothetical protein